MEPAITDNVASAFEMLLEEIETEVELLNEAGAQAFSQGDYSKVRGTAERAEELSHFRGQVASLRLLWQERYAREVDGFSIEPEPAHRDTSRLQRGLRTTESAFVLPILSVIADKGGSASITAILDSLYPLVKDQLKDVDLQPLASDPKQPRWRNTAHWARWSMVQSGLLKSDSPRGIWEITDAGRRHLSDPVSPDQ